VIKIRYSDLPGGLHVRVDVQGRHTILYLLPGLTAAQRKAAIRRASNAARMGHGPGLPAVGVARALAADRIRTTVRNGLAAMRMHPAIFFPPLVIIVAGAYLFLVSVSFRFIPPRGPAQHSAVVGVSHGGITLQPDLKLGAGTPPAGSPGSPSGPVPPGPGRSSSPAPAPSQPSPRGPSSPGPSASPSPAPSSSTPPSPPGPSPSPSPSPSTSPSPGSGSGVCVKVGPVGVCIGL
jgi:hypothetical protein